MRKLKALAIAGIACIAFTAFAQEAGRETGDLSIYDAGVAFLVKADAEVVQRYLDSFPEESRLAAIDYLKRRKAAKYHSPKHEVHTIVYVYSGPVEPGVTVATKFHLQIYGGGPPETYEYKLSRRVSRSSPLIVLNQTKLVSTNGGMVDYRLLINDKRVIHERIEVRH